MSRRPRPEGEVLEVAVEALGAGGDGLAQAPAGRVFVPLALPGERWRVRLERRAEGGWLAAPLERLEGGERASPPCPHFGRCGGCRLQHLPPASYAAFKRERVRRALNRRGLARVRVEEVRTAPLRSRRRLRLALVPADGVVRLGFRRRGSHEVVPVAVCPIALPELEASFGPLAAGLTTALARPLPGELSLTASASGLDLVLHAERAPTLDERQDLAALAADLDLARLSWTRGAAGPETIVERRPPAVTLAGIALDLPAGSFLQATGFGEQELIAAVRAWGAGAATAADLYAGLGTLGLPLAATGTRLHAVEAAPAPLASLRRAAARHGLTVTTEARDLARRPLGPAELDRYDLVLLDPPRAGASAQAQALAQSRVPRLVYAACDPGTFARDARILVDAGYHLLTVRPVDQFLFSPEIELVAHLARDVAPDRP